ncbi:MAG: helix-turn-helix domain-containing protein [Deltaproteobacteria bacterium]|jgi:transposase|nr:helix-turn-helix domain-containing protein [Deltaproteobacteria bacterium]
MPKKYHVSLTDNEVVICRDIVSRGSHSADKRNRARALALLDNGDTVAEEAGVVGMSLRGIEALRKRLVEEGFQTVLDGKPRGHRPCILNDEDEARLVQLACERTEDGTKRWTLRAMSKKSLVLCGKPYRMKPSVRRLKIEILSRGKARSDISQQKSWQSL